MADRLRDLIDLVAGSLDDPEGDGATLARAAGFSRDHLDRLLSAATGETPVALRRRLLLERAAWRLRDGASASEAGTEAGYGSLAAFSRAFTRAHGVAPSTFAASGRPVELDAPNGVHVLGPAGLTVPGPRRGGAAPRPSAGPGAPGPPTGSSSRAVPAPSAVLRRPAPAPRDLTERMVLHHLARVGELLDAAAPLSREDLARPLRPGFVACGFEGEEASAGLMAERLVFTLEVWVAAILGEPAPEPGPSPSPADATAAAAIAGRAASGPGALLADRSVPDHAELRARFDRAGRAFSAIARRVRDEDAWDDGFVDALCEPPQAFTLGGVLSHVLTYGAVRREMLASVLRELGAEVPSSGDPIEWEAGR
ncbi:helix-turn-helix domain-containing protein [Patulibacter minatonensis]|uniref:helix-turn-helix domain-containing protein n=1 Tax=Patulibacter minatonensis TaxID=298163 RepID=UPI00047A2655|nr:AraC family transcriptional regulator [Patulibacter minatonensis]